MHRQHNPSQDSKVFQNDIPRRLLEVRQRLAAAAQKSGRSADSVRLLAASKRQPVERLEHAYHAGQRDFGENYVQELVSKQQALQHLPDLRFHLIGHLQRNKARHAAPCVSSVHSVDSAAVARELDRRLASLSRRIEVFVEVNLGDEPNKSGCVVQELPALIEAVVECPQLELVGLMTIPPATPSAEGARPYFRRLRELSAGQCIALPRLSMGMTSDFEVAIEEGATDVRVGTALFGARA